MNKLKNKKILIVIGVAILSAIVACVLIFTFLSPTRTTVYLFNGSYEAGTQLTSNMLTPVQADSNIIVAGTSVSTGTHFVTRDNYVKVVTEGDTLKYDVYKGDCLMTSMLSSQADNRIALNMNPTSVAVTIPVNNASGVANTIKAENHVNVYVTYNSGGTYLLLENARILCVLSDDTGVTGYTLELNNQEAVRVIDAINTGSVYCALTNSEGYIYESALDINKIETSAPAETKAN